MEFYKLSDAIISSGLSSYTDTPPDEIKISHLTMHSEELVNPQHTLITEHNDLEQPLVLQGLAAIPTWLLRAPCGAAFLTALRLNGGISSPSKQ